MLVVNNVQVSDDTFEQPWKNKKLNSEEPKSVMTDASGDKYIDLGKKRRATVRTFKGT